MKTAVLLLGHGSPRREANISLETIAEMTRNAGGYDTVIPAYLQFASPDFQDGVRLCVEQGAGRIVLMPYFLYNGAHVLKDLPAEIETAKSKFPDIRILMADPLGLDRKIVEVVKERINDVLSQIDGISDIRRDSYPPDKGGEIEKESFRIIDERLRNYKYAEPQYSIVRRVIHTTTDFEFADSMYFSPGAVETGVNALRRGMPVITDVEMVRSGVKRQLATKLGVQVYCAISDNDVVAAAGRKGITRAAAAIGKLSGIINGGVVAIGNAPTALYEVLRLSKEDGIKPALVIGMPVGFVGAAEAKKALAESGICSITNTGPKGGSTVAAATINALMILAAEGRS